MVAALTLHTSTGGENNRLGDRTETSSEKDLPSDVPSGTLTPSSAYTYVSDLASRKHAYDSDLGPVTDWFAHHLHIRRRRLADLDDVATQQSVFDTDQAEFFQPRDDWEVCSGTRLTCRKTPLICRTSRPSTPNSGGLGARRRERSAKLT